MTSLAVELNYNNMTAARGRRRIVIRNPDNTATIAHTTATAYMNNNNFANNINNSIITSSNNINTNNNNNNNNINTNNTAIQQYSHLSTNKMPSPNIIYNLKSGEGVVTCNNLNDSSPSAMSASLALLNRIKSLETQKKRNNQPSSSAIKAAAATVAAANASAATLSATMYTSNNLNSYRTTLSGQQKTTQNNIAPLVTNNEVDSVNSSSPMNSPNSERKSAKYSSQKSGYSKSQEEINKLRVKSANPNVYKDKITDQKFFNRNFKIRPESLNNSSGNLNDSNNQLNVMRYLNDSPTNSESLNSPRLNYNSNSNGTYYEKDLNQLNVSLLKQSPAASQNNMHLISASASATTNSQYQGQSNSQQVNNNTSNTNTNNNQINKLKLLKKRNALKKSLSSAAVQSSEKTTTSHLASNNSINTKSQEKLDPISLNLSKEDLKSQASWTNLINTNNYSTKNLAKQLSRNSLNNIDNGSFTTMNNSQSYQQLNFKSNETVDGLGLNEVKQKEVLSSMSFRVRSNGSIRNNNNTNSNLLTTKSKTENQDVTTNGIPDEIIDSNVTNLNNNNEKHDEENETNLAELENEKINCHDTIQGIQQHNEITSQAKFENKINKSARIENNTSNDSRMNKAMIANTTYLTNRVKSVASNQYLNQYNKTNLLQKRDKSNESSKVSGIPRIENEVNQNNNANHNNNNNNINVSNINHKQENEFKITLGHKNITENSLQLAINNQQNLDYIDPNNIMSDPVIMEQFRKLYEEDEYFQAVHRKCCEWLLKYVFPAMESNNINYHD